MKYFLISLLFFTGCGAVIETDISYDPTTKKITYHHGSNDENEKRHFYYSETRPDGTKIILKGGMTADPNVEALANQNATLLEMTKIISDLAGKFKP